MQTTQPLAGDAGVALAADAFRANPALGIDEGESSFDIYKVLMLIRGNLPLIGTLIAAALIITLAFTLLQTPRYTADTTIQISNQSASILGKDADLLTQGEETSPLDTERFLQTQMDILNSRALAERVATKLKLFNNAAFYEAMVARKPDKDMTQAEVKDYTLNLLVKAAEGKLPHNSRLATISITTADPALSAKISNVWAQEFIQANLQRRFDSYAYARDFIFEQLNDAKSKLEKSELELNAYAREAGLIRAREATTSPDSPGANANSVTTASLLQINAAANQAKAERIVAEQRYNLLKSGNLLSSPDVLANQAVSGLLGDRAKVNADLQRERSKHLDEYPTVVQLKAQLASIDQQIDQIARSIQASVRQQYLSAVQAENDLAQQVKGLQSSSLAEQDRTVKYNLLAREADTNRSLYEGLLQRFKALNAAAGITSSNIAIIDVAETPTKPSSPNLAKNLAIALLASVVLSAAVVLLRQQFDDAVRVPEDVESKLNLSLMGVSPKSTMGTPLEELQDPKSMLSEAYSSICSSLLYASPRGMPKILAITSSQASEGKSTAAFAISNSFARMGRKVLLIDLDLRRPSLHRMFRIKNDLGMSSVLALQTDWQNVVRQTEVENLSLVSSGPIPPNPTQLLSSPKMAETFEELTKAFDLIVVDSPPVLGLADAPLICGMVEGTVMVIESSRSRRGSLRTTLRRLRAVRANVVGAVLTMFDASKVGGRYSEYYGYNYYQYKSTNPED